MSSDYLPLAIAHIPEEWRTALLRDEALPEQAEGAAMMADISGFTPLAEALVRAYCWFDDHPIGLLPTASGAHRASACALAMQAAMLSATRIPIPGEPPITIAVKISIATGPVRRFLVGDPAI